MSLVADRALAEAKFLAGWDLGVPASANPGLVAIQAEMAELHAQKSALAARVNQLEKDNAAAHGAAQRQRQIVQAGADLVAIRRLADEVSADVTTLDRLSSETAQQIAALRKALEGLKVGPTYIGRK